MRAAWNPLRSWSGLRDVPLDRLAARGGPRGRGHLAAGVRGHQVLLRHRAMALASGASGGLHIHSLSSWGFFCGAGMPGFLAPGSQVGQTDQTMSLAAAYAEECVRLLNEPWHPGRSVGNPEEHGPKSDLWADYPNWPGRKETRSQTIFFSAVSW